VRFESPKCLTKKSVVIFSLTEDFQVEK